MSQGDLCPICGDEQPAGSPPGICPRCLAAIERLGPDPTGEDADDLDPDGPLPDVAPPDGPPSGPAQPPPQD